MFISTCTNLHDSCCKTRSRPPSKKKYHTYMGRTAPLTSKRCILYIYSTNIGTEYFKHALYSPFFSPSKCSLFHNANLFVSCIIHILYTGVLKLKKKNNSGSKWLILFTVLSRKQENFRTPPDRPWGPPSLLCNGYRVFHGDKAAGAWC